MKILFEHLSERKSPKKKPRESILPAIAAAQFWDSPAGPARHQQLVRCGFEALLAHCKEQPQRGASEAQRAAFYP